MDLQLVLLATMGGLLFTCIVLTFMAKKELKGIQNNLHRLQESMRTNNG